jgi:hypothetical protein
LATQGIVNVYSAGVVNAYSAGVVNVYSAGVVNIYSAGVATHDCKLFSVPDQLDVHLRRAEVLAPRRHAGHESTLSLKTSPRPQSGAYVTYSYKYWLTNICNFDIFVTFIEYSLVGQVFLLSFWTIF